MAAFATVRAMRGVMAAVAARRVVALSSVGKTARRGLWLATPRAAAWVSVSHRPLSCVSPLKRELHLSSSVLDSSPDEHPFDAIIHNLSVSELSSLLKQADDTTTHFIDVREPYELDVAHLPRFELYPLSSINSWLPKLARDVQPTEKLVVMCRKGARSHRVARTLVAAGFKNVYNVDGGISAYSEEVDPSVPLY
eukprot:m.116090 g.116090  ORF g.116090 m.116090 type:complete len:195 (-) comp16369_c0_seq6:163-747(-)